MDRWTIADDFMVFSKFKDPLSHARQQEQTEKKPK
jgi:hypothetical protein